MGLILRRVKICSGSSGHADCLFDKLPKIPRPLDMDEAVEQKERSQKKCRIRSTVRHARAPMALHQNILLQDRESKLWSIRDQIMSIRPNEHSYVVKTKSGTYLRGIRFIKADNTEQVLVVISAPSKPSRPSCIRRSSKRVTFDLAPEFVP